MKTTKIEQIGFGEQVYNHLKRMILSGELSFGEKIPEGKIATMFQVSRTPIREAIKKLSEYGLVETFPRSYSKVTSISAEQAKSIAELRTVLEKFALHLLIAKKGVDSTILDEMKELSDECISLIADEEQRGQAFMKDTEFHLKMIEATGNEYLYETYEKLDARIQLVRLNMSVTSETFISYINQHYEIINLIREKNEAKALTLIDKHIYKEFATIPYSL
ncbi:MAG: GntR family transcriptional regulator [Spirochaetia bacterium]|nr:GntR family transcriptional regulator [Spirochaetia bacterium]